MIRIVPDSVDFIAQNGFHTAHLTSQIVQFLLHAVIIVQGYSQHNDYKGQCFGSDFIFAHDISFMALSLWLIFILLSCGNDVNSLIKASVLSILQNGGYDPVP